MNLDIDRAFSIVVLDDPSLPYHPWSDTIREWASPATSVSAAELPEALLDADFFLSLHGGTYPVSLEEPLFDFFCRGGGLIHLGEMPFETALSADGGVVRRTLGDIRGGTGHGPLDSEIDVFRARLGIQTYYTPFVGEDCRVVTDPCLLGLTQDPLPQGHRGVEISHSLPIHAVRPELRLFDHRAYQARPTARESIVGAWTESDNGERQGAVLLFVKSWRNPYNPTAPAPRPWVILTSEPVGALPGSVLDAAQRWITSPAFLTPCDVPLSLLKGTETVTVAPSLTSPLPHGWSVSASSAAASIDELDQSMPLKWQRQIGQEVILTSEAGKFIAVAQFAIHDRAGILRDRVLASVVINPDSGYSRGPSIQSDGRYFRITSSSGERRATWLTGTNWQDRHLFAFTWDQPDPLRIAQDATAMARAGIEVCRPHFFHPGWFNATAAEVYGSDDPALKDRFESGPPLSEKHLRAFEAHVALFNAFGIALSPSLFTNPPASMGNPAHWMGTSRLFVIDAYVAAQQEFAEQVMNRLATVPGCFWDLDNEPDTALHEAGPWVERHKRIWGRTGQSVGVGTLSIEDSVLLGESADWHSAHGSLRHGANIFISGKPALLQEAHNPAPTTEEGDDEQATHLSRAIAWTLRYGGAGILPWNWSQSHMNWRYGGGWIDYWDRELGTAVHADSTPRKGLATLTNWAALLRNLTFDQSADEVGFVYPRRFLAGRGSHEYLKLLASRGIPVRAFNDSEPANWNLRGLKLLIFPHAAIGNNKEALLAGRRFAELGGTVWAHNDTAKLDQWGRTHQSLFPIPAISTVEHLGAGRWIWKMGWNFDDHPADSSLPIDLVGFAALLDELHLSTRTSLALTDGTIDFDEHFLMGARSMSSDWASRAPIPDQNVVTRVLVTNNDGAVTRGWAFGQPLEADGLRLSSDGELFMLGRTISSIMIAATRDLVIESARPVGSVTRIQPDVRRRPSDEIIGPPVQALPEGSNRAIIQVGAELSQAWLRVQLD